MVLITALKIGNCSEKKFLGGQVFGSGEVYKIQILGGSFLIFGAGQVYKIVSYCAVILPRLIFPALIIGSCAPIY